jgi:outer membrane protein OmpA-like peptidoglycan-associated protein
VLAGIEALSRLADGTVTVTPDAIVVAGRTGRASARDEIAARAIEALGPQASLDIEVAYVEALDPLAALPTPEECLAKITAVTDAAKITFEPGSDTISSQGEPVVEAIAEILRSCPDLRLRIAGYTDSQGRESSNLELSQGRAEAVLAALRAERVPVAGFEARGFGEADPIASNETEAGREANRRIEFSLIGAEPEGPEAAADAAGAPPAGNGASEAPASGEEVADLAEVQPMEEAPDAPPLRPESVEEEAAAQQPEAEDGTATPPDGEASPEDGPAPAADAEVDEAPAAPDPAEAPATPADDRSAGTPEGVETTPGAPAPGNGAEALDPADAPAGADDDRAPETAASPAGATPEDDAEAGRADEGVAPTPAASDEAERAEPSFDDQASPDGDAPEESGADDGEGTARP